MIRKILSTTSVFVAASASAFLLNLALAKILPPADYATYALLLNLMAFAAMLGDAGIAQKYLRFFLKHENGTYDWPRAVARDLPIALGLITACGLGFVLIYPQVALGAIMLAMLAGLGFMLAQWLCALLRVVTQAWWVALIQRGFPFVMLAAASLLIGFPGDMALKAAAIFALANLLTVMAAALACRRILRVGPRDLPADSGPDGWSFFFLLAGASLLYYGDKLIVARFCSAEDFAAYCLIAAFFQLFDLLNSSLGFLLPSLYAKDSRSSRRIFRVSLAILVPVAGIGGLAVPGIIAWGFPQYHPVSPWVVAGLALAGLGKVLNAVVMANFNLNASSQALRAFTLLNLGLVALGLGAIALAALLAGPGGASMAVGGVWLSRMLLALRAETKLNRKVMVPA